MRFKEFNYKRDFAHTYERNKRGKKVVINILIKKDDDDDEEEDEDEDESDTSFWRKMKK